MSGKFALIIANTEYADSGLARLSAPGKDAEGFARILKDPDGCAFDDVSVLLNQPEHIVRRAIEFYFDQRKPSDLVVLYFSGHGIRDEMGALYLAVKNTVRSRLRSTAIKSDYIREIMDQSRSKRQVLILDCCNSGAFAQGTKAAAGASMGIASAFEGTGYGHIVLTASDSTQFAWEGDQVIGETENSLFTHFLVKGLEGDADEDGDGKITIDELYDYAYEQIVTRTPKQTPGKWSYKQRGEIVLRERTKIEDIRPVPLPADLMAAIENILPYVREGAVRQLGELLKGKSTGLARSARLALEKIAIEDDSKYVASAAKKVLDSFDQIDDGSAKQARQDDKSPEKQETLQRAEQAIKKEDILQKRADAIRIAREREQHERSRQPIPTAEPAKKVKEPVGKRPLALWGIPILLGLLFLSYLAIRSFNFGPLSAPQPTEPRSFEQPTIVAISTVTNTEVPTNPPAAMAIVHTVIVTAPPPGMPTVPTDGGIPSDPTKFVEYYFENINKGNYDLTWSLLSDAYKDRTNPDGKQQYIDFWNDYDEVDISSVKPAYLTSTSVQVNLNATFHKGSKSSDSKLIYFLSLTGPRGTWLFDVVPAMMCDSSPKRLKVGISAKVTTSNASLLLRRTAARGSTQLEELPPGTIVSVIDGPACNTYGSVYFWYWQVRSPSGKIGWVVEGSDSNDSAFIQPVQ